MTTHFNFKLHAILILVLSLSLTACNDSSQPKDLDKVTLQLLWVHQGEFAGSYVAADKGLFAQNGVDVEIKAGGPGISPTEALMNGGADFALMAPEALLKAREAGKPLVALATIYQHSPAVFITLKESGIDKPEQFIGKKITFFSDSEDRVQFEAMMNRLGLADHKTHPEPYSYQYAGLLDGSVDISGAYAVGGVLRMQQKGHQLHIFWPHDYGVYFYGEGVVATEDFVKNNPELVKRFLKALLEGWTETLKDPVYATTATMKRAKEKDQQLQAAMVTATLPLVHTGQVRPGAMDPQVWKKMNVALHRYGVLQRDDLWETAFSTNYLPK